MSEATGPSTSEPLYGTLYQSHKYENDRIAFLEDANRRLMDERDKAREELTTQKLDTESETRWAGEYFVKWQKTLAELKDARAKLEALRNAAIPICEYLNMDVETRIRLPYTYREDLWDRLYAAIRASEEKK